LGIFTGRREPRVRAGRAGVLSQNRHFELLVNGGSSSPLNRHDVPESITLEHAYELHADFVWRTLARLGVAEADSMDAVHEVFLLVHRHLARFEGRSSLRTWLFALCRTVARDARRRARRDRLLFAEEDEDAIDLRADVARAQENRERVELLEQLLATMESSQRNVFILFELETMTGEEIADVLSIPLGTVYSRLTLARRSFRQALERHQAKERFDDTRRHAPAGARAARGET
jgi:RNA polymerase sigma-70 factor, ECF subfamily